MEASDHRSAESHSRAEPEGWSWQTRRDAGSAGLAVQQLKALLRRNLIDRQRTKSTTFCELCSPILLLCVLVYGYSLSDVLVFPEKMYSSVQLNLPGGFGALLPLLRIPMEDAATGNFTAGSVNSSNHSTHSNGVGTTPEEDEGDTLNFFDLEHVFHQAKQQMDGAFKVPDLDTYVSVGTAVANHLDDNAYTEVLGNMESGWTFGNLITQGTLHFAPAREPAVGELVSWLSNATSGFDVLTHRVHESEDDAIAYALEHLEERTWAVIALDEAEGGKVDYTIRMNFTVLPNTNEVVDMIAIGLDHRFRLYYLSGFLTLQTTIDRFLFQRALPQLQHSLDGDDKDGGAHEESQAFCVPPEFVGVPFPTASYDQNLFYAAIGYMLGLAMTMSTMYPLSRLVKSIVEEKENRVRETMRIMGLLTWAHELSWLVTGATVFAFIAVSITMLLSWTFLPLADGSLLLCFMLSFTLSEVGLALLVAAVFSKAKLASIAAPCVLFAGVLPRYIFYGSNRHEAPRSKTFASLLSPTAFTFGADFIGDYEYAGVGAGWGNFSDGEYSLQTAMSMMFLDAVLYGILAWYLDKAVPAEYGTSRNPLGFVWSLPRAYMAGLCASWRTASSASSQGWIPVQADSASVDEEAGIGTEGDPGDYEPLSASALATTSEDDTGTRPGVTISGLRREFGDKVAVAGLNLRLLPGDITCILGHNGAGKSTTISMLTGQLQATSGDATVWGHSVRDNLPKVRQNIGICPQHDALMPLLTAREHLEMYMDIKGMPENLKWTLVTKMLREVGILEKEHTLASHLSGGQKRKLSVALALIGSPKLCILDEPTSGMDPYSRRFTWELLRRGRAGRCTLLSTHFMEEAEHLGDRVAILKQGKLRCAGSPLFLKSRFGLGYKLTLVKAGETFDEDQLSALVRLHVKTAVLLSSAGGEISFRLPKEESKSFHGLFRDLEAGREAMGVGGYGMSVTSLEEVFLSLERESDGRVGNGRPGAVGSDRERGSSNIKMIQESAAQERARHQRVALQDITCANGGDGTGATSHGHSSKTKQPSEIEMHPMKPIPSPAGAKRGRNCHSPDNGQKQRDDLSFLHTEEDQEALLAEVLDDDGRVDNCFAFEEPQAYREKGAHHCVRQRKRESRTSDLDGVEEGLQDYDSVASSREGESSHRIGTTFWEQVKWLMWKRRVVAMRDWKGVLYQVVLPALLVALVLVLLTIDVKLAGPSLVMSADMFDGPTQVLFTKGAGENSEYAEVAERQSDWTPLKPGIDTGVPEGTSTGLSRYLLDTYGDDNDESREFAEDPRPPRYGAFVFGDRIPVNVTIDWDEVRDRPELFGLAFEVAGEVLPADGGTYDLKELLDKSNIDKKELAKAILNLNATQASNPAGDATDDLLDLLVPGLDPSVVLNKTATTAGNETIDAARNWTQAWLDLENQNPTVSFTDAEYLPQSSEIKLEGVVLSVKNQSVDLGEVMVSVEDVLQAMPPGSRSYNGGVLDPSGMASTVMFNTTAPHSLSAWVGEMTARTFKACAIERGLREENVSFVTRNHPLPLTAMESLEVQTMLSLLVSLLVTIPLCYAPAAFVTFLVRERACKSKRVQLVSGASPLAYWLSSYVWDVLLFFIFSVLVMISFVAYGRDASKVFTMHWDSFFGTWGLVMSYGLSTLPLSYLYSMAFDGPSAAQISITGINFLTGFGFVIVYGVLSSLKKTMQVAEKAQHVFRLFPPYLLGDGLIKVSSEFYMREVMGLERSKLGVLAWDVAGMGITYMLLETLLYLTLVLVVEYSLAAGIRSKVDYLRLCLSGWSRKDLADMLRESTGDKEDVDVRAERLRVDEATITSRAGTETTAAPDTVLIRGLTKVYPAPMSSAQKNPKCAVRGLSMGVKRGECFGLLGINGAGKSTILQILTKDLQATSGHVSIDGKPISSGAVCRLLGYCPQTDPLLDLMTVRETLLFFGGLKGVGSDVAELASLEEAHDRRAGSWWRRASSRLASVRRSILEHKRVSLEDAVAKAMSAVSLGATNKQLAGTLSGGNKRKLSLAIALIGEPPVLLLDEPSSGMDPGARRSMWEVITSLSTSRCVILTTHSMEECEAMCDKLGIMVGGRLRCIGTSQHLKVRFGGGYTIEVRCPMFSIPRVTELIRGLSPLARVEELHPTLAKFSVPAGRQIGGAGSSSRSSSSGGGASLAGLSLAEAFEGIEANKEKLQIWDYSINQATLETIFMNFAKDQEEEKANVPGVIYSDIYSDDMVGENTESTTITRGSHAQLQRASSRASREAGSGVEMGWLGNQCTRSPAGGNVAEAKSDEAHGSLLQSGGGGDP